MRIDELNYMISAVCPIDGINSNGDIWFKPEATAPQKAAAKAIMDSNIASLE